VAEELSLAVVVTALWVNIREGSGESGKGDDASRNVVRAFGSGSVVSVGFRKRRSGVSIDVGESTSGSGFSVSFHHQIFFRQPTPV
jgi:hypothetical protein